jgi:UDP-N-acetylglucosamine 2-epimerase (non-hydrolysing)
MKKILCVIGTRPEMVKMAPIISLLRKDPSITLRVLTTAQHRVMLDRMFTFFKISPDIDLNVMVKNQTLAELTANLAGPLDHTLEQEKPDIVLAQGDTTTAFMVSLACFYRKIPFAHVEAGLRTGNFYDPFPEEVNRVLISRLSTLNFAPTAQAQDNLLKEGIDKKTIFMTGNTVIDALNYTLNLPGEIDPRIHSDSRLILVTAHRRENFGEPLIHICEALKRIVTQNKDVQILYPVHPNPNVKEVIYKHLKNLPQIILSEPLLYEQFVRCMKRSYLILSDSGGVQEEAPSIGKPVLVLRDTTERPEAVTSGAAKLVGTNPDTIVKQTQILLDNPSEYLKMVVKESPFGDGKSAPRIITIIKEYLNLD